MEETGYDASAGANEKDFLTLYLNGQQTTMYIVTNVDEGFNFEPQVSCPCWCWCCCFVPGGVVVSWQVS